MVVTVLMVYKYDNFFVDKEVWNNPNSEKFLTRNTILSRNINFANLLVLWLNISEIRLC